MPYFDADGNEVEGLLTQEELDAKLEEERAALQKEHEEAQAAANERIGALEAEKNAAQKALDDAQAASGGEGGGDGGNKEENLAALRKKLEETSAALEEERKANAERFTTIQDDMVNKEISKIAGDDADLAAKIRHNYDNTLAAVKAKTSEEIAAKVANAAKLSETIETPNPLDLARAGGTRGNPSPIVPGTEAKKFNENEVAVGNKMGITDADREKYMNDPRMKNIK